MLFVFSAQKSRPYYIIMKKFVEKSIIKHFSPWIAKFFEKIFEKGLTTVLNSGILLIEFSTCKKRVLST